MQHLRARFRRAEPSSLIESAAETIAAPLTRGRLMRLRRTLLTGLGLFIGLQAFTVSVLFVVALRRKRDLPNAGFPHLRLDKVRTGSNELTVFSYGRDLYDAMLDAIDRARETIYIESFIWKADAVGQAFKDHLAAKADEGVQVYVIFDTFGNLVVPEEFKQFPANIHLRKFWAVRRPRHLIDPRRYALDHRKLLIVDGEVGFIGGYNIGSLYATEWRDTHLRISGPAAMDLAQSFVNFWNRFSPKRERISRYYSRTFDPSVCVNENDAIRLTFPIRDMYIEAIERAQKRILLTNAYFVPDHFLLEALQEAAERGVDVEILIPWRSNHILADWAARGYFTECITKGIRLFGYQDAMIHAKTCTVDGEWTTIGTANLDRLSAVGNYEVNLEIYSREVAAEMERLFACDKTNAIEITAEYWLKRPWYVKLSEFVLAPLRILV